MIIYILKVDILLKWGAIYANACQHYHAIWKDKHSKKVAVNPVFLFTAGGGQAGGKPTCPVGI